MESGKKTILIVDDVLINRTILNRIFSESYEIEEAENGKIALSIMRKKQVSVLLLDLMMPEMNGFEVMAEMSKDKALSEIPIIVITASDDEESLIGVLDAGATDIITKPFNPRMVRARVRNVLSNKESQRLAAESALLKQRIEQREEELMRSRLDGLTGLYTREAFCEKAWELIMEKPEGFYIISSFDINNFKVINDRYGIELGDRVLIRIAEYLKAMANDVGTFASRSSADNYSVIFPVDSMCAISKLPTP